ncbi:MAG: hypothetical protein V1494_01955 [Candidatus Diapherotrites archaeon]
MKAFFEVKDVEQDWRPPFEKKVTEKSFEVEENEAFDRFEGLGSDIFTLVRANGEFAVVKYHTQFTLKGYEQPRDKQVLLKKGEEASFSFLWGKNGLTKKLCFKGFNGDGQQ